MPTVSLERVRTYPPNWEAMPLVASAVDTWLNPKTTEQTVLGRMTIWMHGREISSRFSTETNSS